MLTIEQLKNALDINTQQLLNAMRLNNTRAMFELKTQRDELKTLLIEALEAKLKAA